MPARPRDHLQHLAPYEWEAFTADIARRAGIPESAVVRFDTNTTPWPPVAWEETTLDLPRLPVNEYPHPSNEPLRSELAGKLGVEPEQVVVTCGADEALYLIADAFLGPGREALLIDPTFSMFRVVTQTAGASPRGLPVDGQWDLPPEVLLGALSEGHPAVAWLCSPNNPTGRVIEPTTIAAAAEAAPDTVIVVDEAYYELAGRSALHLLGTHPNLVIVRTFSKGYGLAGARVGYAVAAPAVARLLDAVRPPQNISTFGLAAAHRALLDPSGLEQRVRRLREGRDHLGAALADRGWEVVPSQANFLLTRPPLPAAPLAAWFQDGGLVVRSYPGHPRLSPWLRITVRAPAENQRLLARLDAFGSSAAG